MRLTSEHVDHRCLPRMPQEFQGQRQVRGQDGPLPEAASARSRCPPRPKRSRSTPPRPLPAAAALQPANSSQNLSPAPTLKAHPVAIALIVAAVLLVLLATWVAGRSKLFEGTPGMIVATVGLLLVSPPLVIAAYEVLRDDELEPFRGLSLYVRSAICGLGYVVLWGVFSLLVSPSGLVTGEIWNWVFVVPPFVLVGGFVAFAALDLEFGNAAFHYGFYLVATLLLRWAAGMQWPWLKG